VSNVSLEISGLKYVPSYITQAEHDNFLAIIDEQNWLTDLKRRVQHYGYRYDYASRKVDPDSMYLGPLPDWSNWLINRLLEDKIVKQAPDQLIINEYQPGQGISPHVDCVPCFGDTVVSISLGSTCLMDFGHLDTAQKITKLLEPASLLVMQGEARYKWKHSIGKRKVDTFEDGVYPRGRRVSLTFRNIIL
jgi:alkylated DNA repair dioxygenase AlkB